MKVFIKGLNSCAMRNQKLRQYARYVQGCGHELVTDESQADVVLLWTCAFRADIRDSSLSEITRLQSELPGELIVAGCLPDIDREKLNDCFHGTIVPWKNDSEALQEVFGNHVSPKQFYDVFAEPNLTTDLNSYRKKHPQESVCFHDQFIKLVIAEGCNYHCSYCSERLAFPEYFSFPEEELLEKCRQMVTSTGCKEIVLLADSLGDYGCDSGSSLPGLIQRICGIDPMITVALNNLNPSCFLRYLEPFKALIEAGRIRHLNLPIQSASDNVLKRMNRTYQLADLEAMFSLLIEEGFTEFDTHVIIGFPGETEADFQNTVHFLCQFKPKYVLGSLFMEAPAMPAYQLEGKVGEKTKIRRAEILSQEMTAAGIICNTDHGQWATERCQRLTAHGQQPVLAGSGEQEK